MGIVASNKKVLEINEAYLQGQGPRHWLRKQGHDVVDSRELRPDPGPSFARLGYQRNKNSLVTIDTDWSLEQIMEATPDKPLCLSCDGPERDCEQRQVSKAVIYHPTAAGARRRGRTASQAARAGTVGRAGCGELRAPPKPPRAQRRRASGGAQARSRNPGR